MASPPPEPLADCVRPWPLGLQPSPLPLSLWPPSLPLPDCDTAGKRITALVTVAHKHMVCFSTQLLSSQPQPPPFFFCAQPGGSLSSPWRLGPAMLVIAVFAARSIF